MAFWAMILLYNDLGQPNEAKLWKTTLQVQHRSRDKKCNIPRTLSTKSIAMYYATKFLINLSVVQKRAYTTKTLLSGAQSK